MENTNPQKPLARSGNIAVWPPKKTPNGKLYTVSYELPDNQRKYITVFPTIGKVTMVGEEILELCVKGHVNIASSNDYGPFKCTIVDQGIETRINKSEENTYKNHNMKLGMAYHKLDKDGYTFGYNCNGTGFYAESRDNTTDKVMHLTPKDCFLLLDGRTIFKDGLSSSLKLFNPSNNAENITEQAENKESVTKYKTARLSIQNDVLSMGISRNHKNIEEIDEIVISR